MKKYTVLLSILILWLAGCSPAVGTPVVTPTKFPSPSPTQPACREVEATPAPISEPVFPAVNASDWVRGPADAGTTIIIYDDFQCVECNDRILTLLAKRYPKDLRLVYRHFPQADRYDKTYLAAQAAEAAGRQGHFWEMHDLLYEKQQDWINQTPEDFKTWLNAEAKGIGLDPVQFETDFNDPANLAGIKNAEESARTAGIPVLPLVLINGEIYIGPSDLSSFDQVIRLWALSRRQFKTCPEMTINPDRQYIATIKTARGNIVIELYADKAPLTVNSFVFLARNGWYDGVTFHRVIPGFVAQAGDPSGTGVGGPGYYFRNEIDPSLHYDKPGMVGMANSGADTNGSQFFITYSAQPGLDGAYTIFGHVLSGMDVLETITPRNPSSDTDLPDGDLIISITIEER
jgi:cyclophilin family peptidyl-prolyl cis-trans isomerase/protein-disulfide isomerase